MPRNPKCEQCTLHENATNVCVWGAGNTDEPIDTVVVLESPNQAEDRMNRPLGGMNGKVLSPLLSQLGNTYVTFLVKCIPPGGRPPTPDEIKACRGYIEEELSEFPKAALVTLGSLASKVLLKKSKVTIDHGQIFETKDGRMAMPAYQPSYVMRDPSKQPDLEADFRRLASRLKDGAPDTEIVWSVVNKGNLKAFFRDLAACEEFSFDVETTGLFPYDGKGDIRCLGLGLKDRTWILPLAIEGTPFPTKESRRKVLQLVSAVLAGKRGIAHNGKFDNHWLDFYYGIQFFLSFDTMLAHHMLDENSPHDLKGLSRRYLDVEDYDIPADEKSGQKQTDPMKLFKYCAKDCAYTLRLKQIFDSQLKKDFAVRKLFYRLTMRASRAFHDIEMNGLFLNMAKFEQTVETVSADLDIAQVKLVEMVRKSGHPEHVNWNSPAQVAKFLYGTLQLKPTVFTDKGAPSTGEAALIDIRSQHPVAEALVKYRELEKFRSTYLEGWRELIVGDRIYFSYKLHGTVTGRYSSRLHQVPRDGTIRNLVEAPAGWTFLQGDFSQAEVRLAAEASGDPELYKCFTENIDVHWRTLMNALGSGAGGEYVKPALETANLYCVRQGLSADWTSAQILSRVWSATRRGDSTNSLLKVSLQLWQDSKSRRRVWGSSMGYVEPSLARGLFSNYQEEDYTQLLQSLQQYCEAVSASQGRKSSQQPGLELDRALSLLSSLSPSAAQELWKGWKEARKKAKATVFGFIYGMGAEGFVRYAKVQYGFDITLEESEKIREAFFRLYSRLEAWHERYRKLTKLNGFVRNLAGRKRRLPSVYSPDRYLQSEALRQGINSPIQGMIGDWKAMALVEIHETLPHDEVKVVGEHHDALLMWVRNEYIDDRLPQIAEIMEHPSLLDELKIKIHVPMKAELELGAWGAGKGYKL